MIDTLIYVMVVLIDTTTYDNRFQKTFEEADRRFNIELMKQASHEAALEAAGKGASKVKVLRFYRKED